MNRKELPLLEVIAQELKKGYWKASDAARYAPMLFSLVEPSEKVRHAVALLQKRHTQAEQMKSLQAFVTKEQDGKTFTDELEFFFNQLTKRDTLNSLPNFSSDQNFFREMTMLFMVKNLAYQKKNITINVDISSIYNLIYGKDDENFNPSGEEAIVTEYISQSILELQPNLIINT